MVEAVATVSGVVSALGTLLIGGLAYLFSVSTGRHAANREIGDLANQVAQVRVSHPEVLSYARRWTANDWDVLYGATANDGVIATSRYYAYVEVGLELCNTALAARRSGRVPKGAFDRRYLGLLRLFLTENYPIVEQMLRNPYISPQIREFMETESHTGWDWQERHHLLVAATGRQDRAHAD